MGSLCFVAERDGEKPTLKLECTKLKQDSVDCIDAGAGVSEPGLNRRPDNVIA